MTNYKEQSILNNNKHRHVCNIESKSNFWSSNLGIIEYNASRKWEGISVIVFPYYVWMTRLAEKPIS